MSERTGRARAWHRWRSLDPPARRLLVLLLGVLPVVAASIRLFGLRRVQHVLGRLAPAPAPARRGHGLPEARVLARLVDAASRRAPGRPACLPRSLTLWWLLRRRGIDSCLRIGVRRVEARLEAHAWVEIDGRVVNDEDEVVERFEPFESTDPSAWTVG